MPMKQLNKTWDEEDPNAPIPDHDRTGAKDVEQAMDDVPPPRSIGDDVGTMKHREVTHVEDVEEPLEGSSSK